MKDLIKTIWLCGIWKWHDWTCDHKEGVSIDAEKLKADPVGYFFEYSRMYCKRCGKVYQPYKNPRPNPPKRPI